MKKILTILCFVTVACMSIQAMQKPTVRVSYGQEYIVADSSYRGYAINVLFEMPLLDSGGVHYSNLHGDGVHGDALKLNAVFILRSGNQADNRGSFHKFLFPGTPGGYLFDSSLGMRPFVEFIGMPGTRFVCDANAPGSNFNMINNNQIGNWAVRDITFTNNQSEYMNSFIYSGPLPYTVRNIQITGCSFINSWVNAALAMSGFLSGPSDVTTRLDELLIDRCLFSNLMKPGYPHILTSNDYFNQNGSQLWCGAVNLQQACGTFAITNCTAVDCSGDFLAMYGGSVLQKLSGKYMSGLIAYNTIRKVNMGLELNGGYGGDGVRILDNKIYYCWYYCMSISCNRANIAGNHMEQAEYSCLEFGGTNSLIHDNTALIRTYAGDTSTGYDHFAGSTAGIGSGCAFLEGSGFNNTFTVNTITLDRSNATVSTPKMFNVFKVVGMHRESSNTQDTTFANNNNGRAAYWWFTKNNCNGDITKLIDATNGPIDELHFDDNSVIARSIGSSNTGAMISEFGNGWTMLKNKFNFTGINFNGTVIANIRTDNGTDTATVSSLLTGTENELSGNAAFAGIYKMKPRTQLKPKFTVAPLP